MKCRRYIGVIWLLASLSFNCKKSAVGLACVNILRYAAVWVANDLGNPR